MQMTLAEYIDLERGNATRLAAFLGVGSAYVSQIASGYRKASPEMAVKIEKFTTVVTRKTLRPEDWEAIWPELKESQPM